MPLPLPRLPRVILRPPTSSQRTVKLIARRGRTATGLAPLQGTAARLTYLRRAAQVLPGSPLLARRSRRDDLDVHAEGSRIGDDGDTGGAAGPRDGRARRAHRSRSSWRLAQATDLRGTRKRSGTHEAVALVRGLAVSGAGDSVPMGAAVGRVRKERSRARSAGRNARPGPMSPSSTPANGRRKRRETIVPAGSPLDVADRGGSGGGTALSSTSHVHGLSLPADAHRLWLVVAATVATCWSRCDSGRANVTVSSNPGRPTRCCTTGRRDGETAVVTRRSGGGSLPQRSEQPALPYRCKRVM